MRLNAMGIMGVLMCIPSPVLAQSPADRFADMRLETGQMVIVTHRSGNEIRGRVSKLDATTLTLLVNDKTHEIPEFEAERIDRDGDSVWEGAAIGLAIGGGLALVGGATCSECTAGEVARGTLAFSALGAGAGSLIDLIIPGRTRVFQARTSSEHGVHVVPFAAAGRKGVLVTIGL